MKKILAIALLTSALILGVTGCGEETDTPVEELYPNAVAYTLSSEHTDFLNQETDNDEDVYKLSLTDTGTYTLTLELLDGSDISGSVATLNVYVYDESGNILAESDAINTVSIGGFSRITFEASIEANYYIKIKNSGNKLTKYNLTVYPSVDNGLVQNTDYEPNENQAMAKPLTLAEISDLNSSLNSTRNTDSEDFFKLSLTKTGIYTLTLELLQGSDIDGSVATLNVYIYDESGNILAESDAISSIYIGGFSRITFDASIKANYYIRIESSRNKLTKYNLTVYPSVDNGLVQNTDYEPNENKAMAKPLTLAEISDLNGSLNSTRHTDSEDFFKLSLTATGTYTLTLKMLTGSDVSGSVGSLHAYVYDTNLLTTVDVFEGINNSNSGTFSVSVAGDYYIQVNNYRNKLTHYNLRVTK